MARSPSDQRPLVVTPAQVAAFRLRRQHLDRRAPKSALARVVADMGGAQAQVVSAAGLSLAARLTDLRSEDVERAIERRRLVRAWCMRRTLHLLSAESVPVYLQGTARRCDRELTWVRNRGVPADRIERLLAAILDVLDEPVDGAELTRRVGDRLGLPIGRRKGGGWGSRSAVPVVRFEGLEYSAPYLLHLAGARGMVCFGPKRGATTTFVRVDRWIDPSPTAATDRSEEDLFRIYLRTFGPAPLSEFAFWTGLRLRDAQRIRDRVRAELTSVVVEGSVGDLLAEDAETLARARVERSLRLLPYFDGFVLGHRSRGHLIDPARKRDVYRPQGWVAPVLLRDGRVEGVWEHEARSGRLHLRVRPFRPLPAWGPRALREDAEAIAAYFGLEVGPTVVG